MNLETFLDFWTSHNRVIIELTFGFIFIFILFLIYRQFFSHGMDSEGLGSGKSMDINTVDIEAKLQKIIDSQLSFKGTAGSSDVAKSANISGSSDLKAVVSTEVVSLKKELDELREQVKVKDTQLAELSQAKANSAVASSPASSATSEDKAALESKLKELEGRLQEYEIISEDIADLSFYKEENSRLQKELSDLKGGASNPTQAKAQALPVEPTSKTEEIPQASAATPSSVTSDADTTTAPGPIDDDIMKEFAAAIEDQKKSPVETGAQPDSEKIKESQQLMGDFENFLKKG